MAPINPMEQQRETSNLIVATIGGGVDDRVFLFKDGRFFCSGRPDSDIWDRVSDIRYVQHRYLPDRAVKHLLIANDLPQGVEWEDLDMLRTQDVAKTPLGYVRTREQKALIDGVSVALDNLNLNLIAAGRGGLRFDIWLEDMTGVGRWQSINLKITDR